MTSWWEDLRAAFPMLARRAYFFWGAAAPLATPVRDAITGGLDTWAEAAWRIEQTEFRWLCDATRLAGGLVGCGDDRIVLVESTSHAMNVAAQMVQLKWQREGARPVNVLVHPESHPAATYPWLNAARLGAPFEVRRVPAGAALEDAVDTHTIAVLVPHVSFRTGERFDLGALAARHRDRSWALIVDAAQSAGVVPVDVDAHGFDFVAFPAYKWLLGPAGVGFLAASPPWIEGVGPPAAGWAGTRDVWSFDPMRFDPAPAARGFRLGMPGFLGIAGAAAGLRLLEEAGTARTHGRVNALVGRTLDGLASLGYTVRTPLAPGRRAGIVSVAGLADPAATALRLAELRLDVGVEPPDLRIDVHAGNAETEVDRLLDALASDAPADRRH